MSGWGRTLYWYKRCPAKNYVDPYLMEVTCWLEQGHDYGDPYHVFDKKLAIALGRHDETRESAIRSLRDFLEADKDIQNLVLQYNPELKERFFKWIKDNIKLSL